MKTYYVDCDVILDLLMAREPFFYGAAKLFQQAEDQKIKLVTTPLAIANAFYLLRKQVPSTQGKKILSELLNIIQIIPISQKNVYDSLESPFNDFEDALQHFSALHSKCDGIITRNKKDFKHASIQVFSPSELCS